MVLWLFHGKSSLNVLYFGKSLFKISKSYFINDAKLLFNEYRYFIFFGLDNTPVSNEYAPNTWFDPDALQQIRFYQLRANQV